jgi:thioredoxin-related protein
MLRTRNDVVDFAVAALVIMAVLVFPGDRPFAARNEALVTPMAGPYQLVVVEIEGCAYCPVLRRDAIPAFEATAMAKEVPVRFLDLNAPEAKQLTLTEGPLTVVPTLLLVKDNREVGRAAGYMGPDGFVMAAKWLMQNAP